MSVSDFVGYVNALKLKGIPDGKGVTLYSQGDYCNFTSGIVEGGQFRKVTRIYVFEKELIVFNHALSTDSKSKAASPYFQGDRLSWTMVGNWVKNLNNGKGLARSVTVDFDGKPKDLRVFYGPEDEVFYFDQMVYYMQFET
mmetsp:Transcript_33328/g.51077  ORF Transcript_33328/g.51077 Transcript_33328/m.51077 type:complete len:141 (+) Transcript_33328:132-554(+)|eukprot:CAMPEP_0170480014 /NCGR_PEP_ID=MMETSP0208-20121228/1016_1 /TAXON_ID=197538 /ORGANISM="Strombidium inclinatum, Strain S3" /LENGTH=140 /DNA_ID=CAMNT_0010752485 /DNA_START=83 /DNA_END=505 /DNA_ORIENTATION=+